LLDELRLDAARYHSFRQAALNRGLAAALAAQQGEVIPPEKMQEVVQDLRRARGLLSSQATRQWLEEHDLDEREFSRLVSEHARLLWATDWGVPDLGARVIDELRLDGDYVQVRERARHKHQVLEEVGLSQASLADLGLTLQELLSWYFAGRAEGPVPSDLRRYARDCGFRDEQSFIQAALREYCYLRYRGEPVGPPPNSQEVLDEPYNQEAIS
jgi:hypothetical protein